jgi:hypothetical protein
LKFWEVLYPLRIIISLFTHILPSYLLFVCDEVLKCIVLGNIQSNNHFIEFSGKIDLFQSVLIRENFCLLKIIGYCLYLKVDLCNQFFERLLYLLKSWFIQSICERLLHIFKSWFIQSIFW